jgi:hypothetical protein
MIIVSDGRIPDCPRTPPAALMHHSRPHSRKFTGLHPATEAETESIIRQIDELGIVPL